MSKSQSEILEIERNQAELRHSIDEARRLADDSDQLLERHRRAIGAATPSSRGKTKH